MFTHVLLVFIDNWRVRAKYETDIWFESFRKKATWEIEAQINRNESWEQRTAEFKLYWNGSTDVGMVCFCDASFCVPWYRTSPISKRPVILNISSCFFIFSFFSLRMSVFSWTSLTLLFFFVLLHLFFFLYLLPRPVFLSFYFCFAFQKL